jgi:tRNA (guanine10-N2)-dimethyltransferase
MELISVLNAFLDRRYKQSLIDFTRLVEVEIKDYSTEIVTQIANRLAMSKNINEIIIKETAENFSNKLKDIKKFDIDSNLSFKLFSRVIEKKKDYSEREIKGFKDEIIKKLLKKAMVNVTAPDVEFVVYFGREIILVKKILDIDRSIFERRKPQFRPYFAPISLHPRLAKCLVNLAEPKMDAYILDPFCGTGGILLEAGLMGFPIIGTDIDSSMVEGTKKNLDHLGVNNYEIFQAEIDELPLKLGSTSRKKENQINPLKTNGEKNTLLINNNQNLLTAIVTEPPYGRATTTYGEPIEKLLERAFKVFHILLPRSGRVVISLPDGELSSLADEFFIILNEFRIKIHKSLTKHIFVFERK